MIERWERRRNGVVLGDVTAVRGGREAAGERGTDHRLE